MTKTEFLTGLTDALSAIPAADRDAAVAYFSEQIDDLTESGMPESEAVASLGSFSDIVAALAEDIPSADAPDVDVSRTPRTESRSYTTEQRPPRIALHEDNCAVEILPSPDHLIRIDYTVSRYVTVNLDCRADCLSFTAKESRLPFAIFRVGRQPTRLYLPADYLPDLTVSTGNAPLKAAGVSCRTANLKTANASLHLHQITAPHLTAKTANAPLKAEFVSAETVHLTTANASLTAEQIKAERIELKTANARLHAAHLTAVSLDAVTANAANTAEQISADTIRLISANGRITLRSVTGADSVTLKTSNAAVDATLPGSMNDYRIISSGGGRTTLPPRKAVGNRSLEVSTSNGKINVLFADDQTAERTN